MNHYQQIRKPSDSFILIRQNPLVLENTIKRAKSLNACENQQLILRLIQNININWGQGNIFNTKTEIFIFIFSWFWTLGWLCVVYLCKEQINQSHFWLEVFIRHQCDIKIQLYKLVDRISLNMMFYSYLYDTSRIGRFTANWWIRIFLDP